MNYEEALKTAYELLSASWDKTCPLSVRDTYDADKNVRDEVVKRIADELCEARRIGYEIGYGDCSFSHEYNR